MYPSYILISSDVSYDLWCSTTGSPQVLRPSVSNISLKTNYPTTTLVNSSSSHQNKPQGNLRLLCQKVSKSKEKKCSKKGKESYYLLQHLLISKYLKTKKNNNNQNDKKRKPKVKKGLHNKSE